MGIKQLTRIDQPALDVWHSKASNDPTVFPFLSFENWVEEFDIGSSTWGSIYFMDDAQQTLLIMTPDRVRRSASAALWSLDAPGRAHRVAAMMRFLRNGVARRYDIDRLFFSISRANTEWLAAVQQRFGGCLWGIKPDAAYDRRDGKCHDTLHFVVPLSRETRNGR